MAEQKSALEKVLAAFAPKDLADVSEKTLHKLQDMISDALKTRAEESYKNKKPGEMSGPEYDRWSRIEIAKGEGAQ